MTSDVEGVSGKSFDYIVVGGIPETETSMARAKVQLINVKYDRNKYIFFFFLFSFSEICQQHHIFASNEKW